MSKNATLERNQGSMARLLVIILLALACAVAAVRGEEAQKSSPSPALPV